MLNVFENSGATLRLFIDDEKDEHNIAELEPSNCSEHVGPIKYVLAAGLSTGFGGFNGKSRRYSSFYKKVETNFVVANERDDVIDTEDYVFTTADLDTAISSQRLFGPPLTSTIICKKKLHEVN